jgi:hypothetical protein
MAVISNKRNNSTKDHDKETMEDPKYFKSSSEENEPLPMKPRRTQIEPYCGPTFRLLDLKLQKTMPKQKQYFMSDSTGLLAMDGYPSFWDSPALVFKDGKLVPNPVRQSASPS